MSERVQITSSIADSAGIFRLWGTSNSFKREVTILKYVHRGIEVVAVDGNRETSTYVIGAIEANSNKHTLCAEKKIFSV